MMFSFAKWNPSEVANIPLSCSDTDTNMQYSWAEDDFDAPPGVGRLGLSAPGDNRKYVMYHGTTRAIAQSIQATGFRQSTDGMLGRGVYLSRDLLKASRYPIDHPEQDRAVIKCSVNVGKVIKIDHQDHPKQKTWHKDGFDTAWVPPNCRMVKSGLEEDCVWDPSRITISKVIDPKPVQTYGARGYM
ncbi:Protein mono-ADP-ribosyltransferase PARP3 [Dissostichus eleginoides]|uniref:Protein mono-ADP-ribosyltransferase PARP3 n=1 Tax=Dissostichus eleginoides TaxID=100907 RepID=A0AAD9B6Q3_DISEL|nr:Protein mono-ADP-ribosyltransferase PARP3 [Dissostichus eleginoides]